MIFIVSFDIISCQVDCFAANEWQKGTGEDIILGTETASDIDTVVFANIVDPIDRVLAGFRQECKISYSSASAVSIGTGEIVCSNAAGTIRKFRRNTSAITTSWSVADNGLDAGTEASSSTYYIFACADADATTFTIKVTTNSSAPTGITYYKRLGYFYNDASSNITQIVNDDNSGDIAYVKGQGNYYKIDSGTTTVSASSTASVSYTFTFASAPVVSGTVYYAGSDSPNYQIYTTANSTTGCTFKNNNSQEETVHWIAVGQVLAQ